MYEADPTLAEGPETLAASKRDLQTEFLVTDRCSGMAVKGAETSAKESSCL